MQSLLVVPSESPEATDRGDGDPFSPSPTSLDRYVPKAATGGDYSRRQKRLYHRAMSGLARRRAAGESPKLLTLTTADASMNAKIATHFHTFVQWARFNFGRFEYCRVAESTVGGLLHFHTIVACGFIPQSAISEKWAALHGAGVVDIRQIRQNTRRMAHYLVSYLADGLGYAWSAGWVCRGFCAIWAGVKRQYGDAALGVWLRMLGGYYVAVTLRRRPHTASEFIQCNGRGWVFSSTYACFGTSGLLTRSSLQNRFDV